MSHPFTGYEAAAKWLFSTQERGVKLGLENIRRLLGSLKNPEKGLRFIHVAGTNGKGSVCALLDSILRSEGYKTGLFTSPHLVRFNERIQVSGVAIGDDSFVRGIEQIRALIKEEHHPTFFEITTALALDHFRREKVDLVILETGLGGRMDATNVVIPLVSVLTSIDLDHQAWLGTTLSEIAFEKSGIIKPGVPVVSLPQFPEVSTIINRSAQEKGTAVTYVDGPVKNWDVALPGSHQRLNAAAAIKAIEVAGVKVGAAAIRSGLTDAFWPARFQIIEQKFVLDGAHNASATARLVQTWQEQFGDARPIIIFGGLADKDLAGMAANLSEIAFHFLLVPVRNSRAVSPQMLQGILPIGTPFTICGSVKAALDQAETWNKRILITGSLFLAGEALAILSPGHGVLQSSNQ